ncbi:MAG: FliH/SctL family protein [Acidimicrobiales bacterium]
MSSSTDTPRRARVLRDVSVAPVPVLADLGLLTGPARRAVDPAAVAEAQAAGHAAGRAEGYDAGRLEALADAAVARAALADAGAAALAALERASAELAAREARSLADVEHAVLACAFELATAVVGRELALASDPGRDALRRALVLAPERESVTAHLHPDDVALLGDPTELSPGREVTVVADPAVERGGCVLEAGPCRIDAQLGAALARVKAVLAP